MFWKLFGSYGTLILVSLGILGAVLSRRLYQEMQTDAEQSLAREAALLEPVVRQALTTTNSRADELQEAIIPLANEAGVRISVFGSDGRPIADTQASPQRMENHRNREEVVQALSSKWGCARRRSATLGRRFLYVARRVDVGEKRIGFIRIALPLETLEARASRVQYIIWAGVSVIGISATLFTVALSTHFRSRLQQLSSTAVKFVSGDYEHPIGISGNDQIGRLAHALHQMRRQLTEQTADSERARVQLETMLETMPEGVLAIDSDERTLFANRTAHEFFGIARGALARQRYWEILRHPALQDAVAKTWESSEPHQAEFEILNPFRVVAYRGSHIDVAGRPGVLMVLHDMTEFRQLERLRQEFLANVSHELKTPLAAIKAFAETLGEGALDDPQAARHFVQRIEEQAERLNSLVVDMLNLARVEADEQAFDVGPVDLAQVVVDSVAACGEQANAKRLSITTNVGDGRFMVLADAEGLRTIISNLLSNAVNYTAEGGAITVSVMQEEATTSLVVEDNGPGIPSQDLGRIFERFYRVDKARSRELGGTGLGLSIVKHLSQTFGGSVTVQSKLKHGSKFTVRLPNAGALPASKSMNGRSSQETN